MVADEGSELLHISAEESTEQAASHVDLVGNYKR
jgi:hypothetical protein